MTAYDHDYREIKVDFRGTATDFDAKYYYVCTKCGEEAVGSANGTSMKTGYINKG